MSISDYPGSLEIINTDQTDIEVSVSADNIRVKLHSSDQHLEYRHSFTSPSFYKRLRETNQALYKACRNKQRNIHSILDLTGGWGIDSFLLAHQGYEVTMLEQNELVHNIVSRSLTTAKTIAFTSKTCDRITAIHTNALLYLTELENNQCYDCIYLDPMFPDRKSTAKPGKEMQILQALTKNLDIIECASMALTRATKRVVIKRPAKAPVLISDRPADIVYREKTIRFDVYLTA